MDFSAILTLPNYQRNMFSSMKIETENIVEAPKKVELLDIYITQFSRHCEEDLRVASYTFTYFDNMKVDFMQNQDHIQLLANDFFGHTAPLGDFEQTVLNHTYARSMKNKPTRSNRL